MSLFITEQYLIDGPESSTPPPEWSVIPPEWTQDDQDQDQGYEEEKECSQTDIDDECEDSMAPSLYHYDPEIPMTSYLRSEEDAYLFMIVMFTDNEFTYSNIVPDRLYKQLPEYLLEIVDDYTDLMTIACNAHNSPKDKFVFENTDIPGDIEQLCFHLRDYIASEDMLPFANVYVAKFIHDQILEGNDGCSGVPL